MKNIFTTKVKWFKKEPKKPTQYEWTHVYTNSLGNPVQCIVHEDLGVYKWVINSNGCHVRLLTEDLETLSQYNLRVNNL